MKNTMEIGGPNHLEPRVAKLETGLEILTRDVATLAQVTREQGKNLEHELQKLTIAVTQASGPRKTDWASIISGVMLVMAIGSAVFWPLNQTAMNNQSSIDSLVMKFEEHQKLNLHPVGSALLQRLEGQLEAHVKQSDAADKAHDEADSRGFQRLDKRIQEAVGHLQDLNGQRFQSIEKSIQDLKTSQK